MKCLISDLTIPQNLSGSVMLAWRVGELHSETPFYQTDQTIINLQQTFVLNLNNSHKVLNIFVNGVGENQILFRYGAVTINLSELTFQRKFDKIGRPETLFYHSNFPIEHRYGTFYINVTITAIDPLHHSNSLMNDGFHHLYLQESDVKQEVEAALPFFQRYLSVINNLGPIIFKPKTAEQIWNHDGVFYDLSSLRNSPNMFSRMKEILPTLQHAYQNVCEYRNIIEQCQVDILASQPLFISDSSQIIDSNSPEFKSIEETIYPLIAIRICTSIRDHNYFLSKEDSISFSSESISSPADDFNITKKSAKKPMRRHRSNSERIFNETLSMALIDVCGSLSAIADDPSVDIEKIAYIASICYFTASYILQKSIYLSSLSNVIDTFQILAGRCVSICLERLTKEIETKLNVDDPSILKNIISFYSHLFSSYRIPGSIFVASKPYIYNVADSLLISSIIYPKTDDNVKNQLIDISRIAESYQQMFPDGKWQLLHTFASIQKNPSSFFNQKVIQIPLNLPQEWMIAFINQISQSGISGVSSKRISQVISVLEGDLRKVKKESALDYIQSNPFFHFADAIIPNQLPTVSTN